MQCTCTGLMEGFHKILNNLRSNKFGGLNCASHDITVLAPHMATIFTQASMSPPHTEVTGKLLFVLAVWYQEEPVHFMLGLPKVTWGTRNLQLSPDLTKGICFSLPYSGLIYLMYCWQG